MCGAREKHVGMKDKTHENTISGKKLEIVTFFTLNGFSTVSTFMSGTVYIKTRGIPQNYKCKLNLSKFCFTHCVQHEILV